jgi:hypothetical protein
MNQILIKAYFFLFVNIVPINLQNHNFFITKKKKFILNHDIKKS